MASPSHFAHSGAEYSARQRLAAGGHDVQIGSRSGKHAAMQGEALNENNFRIAELFCLPFPPL